MRILHVIDSLQPRRGGPPVVAASLAAAQAQLGHDVTILSYAHQDAPNPEDLEPIDRQVPNFDNVDLLRLPMPGLLEKILGRAAGERFARLNVAPDVVHLHQVWEGLLHSIAQRCRQAGVGYVLTPHGMLHPWSLAQSKLKKSISLALRTRSLLHNAAALHALNADEAAVIEKLGFAAPTFEMPNGVWLDHFASQPARSVVDEVIAGLHGRPFMLFLARLHHKKGADLLVRAFATIASHHPDMTLVLAGSDYGEQATLQTLAADLKLADRVLLPGPIYDAAKHAALTHATLFCLSSHQEGLPVGVLEALACGTPVVISDACNMPIVAQREAGLVLPLDITAFAQGIDQLLRDANLRASMGERGQELVAEQFTWASVAEQSIRHYERFACSA